MGALVVGGFFVIVFGALVYVTSPAWGPRLRRWRNKRAEAAIQEEDDDA